jgi:DNA-binding CsgD family transcriptional regulator
MLCLFNMSIANTVNPKKLEDLISNLNDKHEYKEAIITLEQIINSKNSTHFDKFNAYLQKSYTYKRLYNYVEALTNLDNAYKYGIKSIHKDYVEIQILLEKLFIEFDQKKFEDANNLLSKIDKNKLKLITGETKAFYLSIVANLAMREQKYDIAEKYIMEAIKLVEKQNPKHLPNIYRVKVALHGYTKEHDKVIEAYEKGLYYANKYKVDIYKIIMHEALCRYYTYKDDYKNAFLTQKIINEAITKYDSKNNSGQLSLLEKELLEVKKSNELKAERIFKNFLIILSSVSFVLIIALFLLYRVTKQKKKLVEKENKRIRKDLELVTQSLNEKGNKKIDIENSSLTDRQKQIIDLVKLGKTNKEIGTVLFISENTVKYHLKIIYDILKIENRIELK